MAEKKRIATQVLADSEAQHKAWGRAAKRRGFPSKASWMRHLMAVDCREQGIRGGGDPDDTVRKTGRSKVPAKKKAASRARRKAG